MTPPPPQICQKILKLHALLGSCNEKEAEAARSRLVKLLAKHDLSWNDVPEILAIARADAGRPNTAARQAAPEDNPEVNVLDLVLFLLEQHVAVTTEERLTIALWVLHTYVFDQFNITPRLAVLSPVRECGKTSLIELIELLVKDAHRSDNVTPAAIYHTLASGPHVAMLLDEGDNLGLLHNEVLRSLFNSGHRRGGSIDRFIGGRPRRFPTFAPLAVAAIGDALPLPLLGRSVIIRMQRYAPTEGRPQIKAIDREDPAFSAARGEIRKWAATCSLKRAPEMPRGFRNRVADNWRVLLSVADDLGHSDAARAAAVALRTRRSDEDPGVVLLDNIRTIFFALGIDRIVSVVMIRMLLEIEDGPWNEWRGLQDHRPPRKLTQSELAFLLRPFGIRPRTIWPTPRRPSDRSARGYLRSQFEDAWRAYCPAADTPTQPSKITYLRR